MEIKSAATLLETMQGIEDEVRSLAAESILSPDEDCLLGKVNCYQAHDIGCIGDMVEKIADLAAEIQSRLRTDYGLGRRRIGASLAE